MSKHIMWRLKEQTPYTNVLDGELMKEAAAEIERLREENARLQAQRKKDKRLNHETESGLLEENARLREENARMREALEFYPDSKNYSEIETGIGMLDGMSERDCCGRRAREALGMEE